jgi:PilZ domain
MSFEEGDLGMPVDRRRSERHPVGFYVDQFIDDQPLRCFTTDLSLVGLYMERPVQAINRSSKYIQLEFRLPRCSDSIWATGEVIYDRLDSRFHGTAVRFDVMAEGHRRMLSEWLNDTDRTGRFIVHPRLRRPKVSISRPKPPAELGIAAGAGTE